MRRTIVGLLLFYNCIWSLTLQEIQNNLNTRIKNYSPNVEAVIQNTVSSEGYSLTSKINLLQKGSQLLRMEVENTAMHQMFIKNGATVFVKDLTNQKSSTQHSSKILQDAPIMDYSRLFGDLDIQSVRKADNNQFILTASESCEFQEVIYDSKINQIVKLVNQKGDSSKAVVDITYNAKDNYHSPVQIKTTVYTGLSEQAKVVMDFKHFSRPSNISDGYFKIPVNK